MNGVEEETITSGWVINGIYLEMAQERFSLLGDDGWVDGWMDGGWWMVDGFSPPAAEWR